MSQRTHTPDELQRIYGQRFDAKSEYRQKIWNILARFFQRWIPLDGQLLDLGCGYGEFLHGICARKKWGMDLNPESRQRIPSDAELLAQDCSAPWPLADGALTTVFTSNFFEHLPDKETLGRTLDEIVRTLAPNGRLIAMGPNIAKVHGRYWDFWDHYLPLSERSLCEALRNRGFEIEICHAGFLPYTMEGKKASPLWIVELYLRMPLLWRFLGEQFLVIAKKR